jgi:UDP-N-acetyl-D-galactosamine dehydrogenase
VGGHCIGVDPYYLIDRARQYGYTPSLLEQVRKVNESMVPHIVSQIKNHLRANKIYSRKVLIKGITFKEDVNDIRNSKVADIALALIKENFDVTVEDPHAVASEVKEEYGFELTQNSNIKKQFGVVIMAVNHQEYQHMDSVKELLLEDGLLYDVRGTFKHLASNFSYKTL